MAYGRDNTRVIKALEDYKALLKSGASDSGSLDDNSITRKLTFDESMTQTEQTMYRSRLDLENQVRALKAQLLERKAEVERLKVEHSWDEPARKKICVAHQREVDSLQEHLQKEKEKNEDLKQQLIKALEKDAKNRSQYSQLKQQFNSEKLELEEKLRVSQKDCNTLATALEEHVQESSDATSSLEAEVKRLNMEEILLRSELKRAEEKEALLTKQLQEKQSAMSEAQASILQLQTANLRIRELERQLSEQEETTRLAKIMKSDLEELPRLRKENAEIKEENRLHRQTRLNVGLMEEQLDTARQKVAQHEALQQRFAQQAVEMEQLKQTLASWEALVQFSKDLKSPCSVKERITRSKETQLLLSDQVAQLKAQNGTMELKLQAALHEEEKLKTELGKLNKSYEEQTTLLRRVQRRLLMAGQEREAYKGLLDSFQRETTVDLNSALTKQMQSLEAVVENYRHTLEQAEKEIAQLRSSKGTTCVQSASLQDAEVQTDPIRVADEEKREGALKIVHLKDNPLEVAHRQRLEAAKKLEEENELLQARIKILERYGCTQDVTAKVQQSLQQGEDLLQVKSLGEQLKAAETKNRRLLEAFKRTSKEFREVCYLLTGYRIDIPEKGKYRLSHMYAELQGDNLYFEMVGDKLNLLESNYSAQLGSLIETYLHKHHSIPAFLSALTMQLFGQQTCVELEETVL
uniref:Putative paramyosin n=1 Tax=Ornithodoros turicata TaxID=34597 RepID=A0A2R5LAY9_9ACAR